MKNKEIIIWWKIFRLIRVFRHLLFSLLLLKPAMTAFEIRRIVEPLGIAGS